MARDIALRTSDERGWLIATVVVPAGTPIPFEVDIPFFTTVDRQEAFEVQVLERSGKSMTSYLDAFRAIGEMQVRLHEPAAAASPIICTIGMTSDGQLSVTVAPPAGPSSRFELPTSLIAGSPATALSEGLVPPRADWA